MKIIDWKIYKEVNLGSLTNEELIEVIIELQNKLDKKENPYSSGIATNPLGWVYT